MRCSLFLLIISLGSLIAVAQTSSPPAPPAPKSPDAQAAKPGNQAVPPAKSPATKPEAGAKEVAPDAAVITIKGLCSTPGTKTATSRASATKASGSAASKPATCQTVITKKQLDRLIEAVRPNLPAQQRRMLAQQYVELLTMADAAAKAGVEKEPKVQEQMRLQKLQILATSYSRELQQKYSDVPQADIEKYYKENASKYEQAKLQRIYIPMVTPEGKPPDAAATKIIAEKIQQRAAAGEDFDKLQKDAFAVAENKGTPPSVEMGERRRGTLPPRQEDTVFGLKAGEVSPALEETSGFYIYKVVGKETLPLDKVREEIKGILGRERFREGIEKIRGSVQPTFNEAYFGGPAQPPAAPGESGAPPSTRPPGQEAVPPTAQTAAPPSGQTAAPPATPAPAPSGTPQAPNAPPPVPPK